jgi:hypothetical protein
VARRTKWRGVHGNSGVVIEVVVLVAIVVVLVVMVVCGEWW